MGAQLRRSRLATSPPRAACRAWQKTSATAASVPASGSRPAANLLVPAARYAGPVADAPPVFDPTLPEALARITAVAAEAAAWGYDLIRHDFTTFELFGQWGSQMGASPTRGNWHLHDRTRTNAEVLTSLYRATRAACGDDRIIPGCNTIGHLFRGHLRRIPHRRRHQRP